MSKDWQAVADAVDARLGALGMSQMELASKAGVSLATVREIHRNLQARRRSRRTLSALSTALGWPSDYLWELSDGQSPNPDADSQDPVLRSLDEMQAEIQSIQRRLADVERRVAGDDESP